MEATLDLEAFGTVALAGLLGGIIGIEREIADKPAGLRTHIFVASACALLVVLAKGAVDFFEHHISDQQIDVDPIRVIQAIVIGISFLGAGTIVHREDRQVEGLTTAASIFLTACIGIAVGIDRVWLATEVALFALIVLVTVRWIEERLLREKSAEDGGLGSKDSVSASRNPEPRD